MVRKSGTAGGARKPQGHFCKICGGHKANEKFSGKGHAAHICKECAALPVAERNEMETVRKIWGMSHRYLTEQEINWLRNRRNDSRLAVREAALNVHHMKFPRYERGMAKKGMTAFSLELYLHDEIYNAWGDAVPVHARLFADRMGIFRRINYSAPGAEQEESVSIDPKEARCFLKSLVHEMEAPFWDEDISDVEHMFDPYLDILPEYRPGYGEIGDGDNGGDGEMDEDVPDAAADDDREPLCSLELELNTGIDKRIVFYNRMPDEAVELYWSLMDYFEPEDEDDLDSEE